MAITYGDHLIDSGYYDITPEQERERDVEAATSIDPIIAWMVARGWLDPDAEYTTTDLIAALDDNAAPDHSPREASGMYPNTVCPHDCYRPGDCDGSCTHPAPSPVVPSGLEALVPDYDAGLLNDYGAGDVAWWQDYLRAEIGRANDHWRERHTDAIATLRALADRKEGDA